MTREKQTETNRFQVCIHGHAMSSLQGRNQFRFQKNNGLHIGSQTYI